MDDCQRERSPRFSADEVVLVRDRSGESLMRYGKPFYAEDGAVVHQVFFSPNERWIGSRAEFAWVEDGELNALGGGRFVLLAPIGTRRSCYELFELVGGDQVWRLMAELENEADAQRIVGALNMTA